jgi:glycerophosphoryl diester phosphodiesterase
VLAHRGLAVDAPENTLLAFARALAAGVTHLETDVHASADGVAILSHDPDLFRLTGRRVRIDQLTASELTRIDLGESQTFVTLSAALEAYPDARFNIDITAAAAAVPAIEAIRGAHAERRVLIGSFSNARRLAVVRRLPGVATSVSSRGAVIATWAGALGLRRVVRFALRGVQAVQLPVRVLGVRTTSPRVIAAYHSAGVEVHIWTINDPAEMTRLLDAGVDGLVSDRADIALDVLAKRRSGSPKPI